jgi:plastocyanin
VTPAGGIRTPNLQGGADGPDRSVPSPNLIIELQAKNSAFSETELQAPAYAQVSVIFENADKNTSHSFSLYRTPNGTDPVFIGGSVAGEETRTFTFTTPEPGTYYFRDDLMPGLLNGTFEIK